MKHKFNLFCAAIYTNNYMKGQSLWDRMLPCEQEHFATLPNILESYHYIYKGEYVNQIRNDGGKVFLDSGAFTAYTLGQEIHLGQYVRFIKDNEDIIRKDDGVFMAAVLDSIGNDHETYLNQKRMEKMGITPVPCFHHGEDTRYLEYYVNNYEYLSLGGLVGASSKALQEWLDPIWEKHLIDGSGKPKLKVHAFGLTSLPLMQRYPWASADSSSWVQNTSFGSVMTEKYGTISISSKSPSRQDKGQHISNFTKIERKEVEKYILQKGFDIDRLANEYPSRAAFNVMAYREIGEGINCPRLKTANVNIL